ncbi:MAG: 7TM diverse intracellular signaling domain-containing protein, partial [Spirochaetales bacterium]|nr:7TM diverse intracellular signaling domain-containing protein [Spirochaetales bacterium]
MSIRAEEGPVAREGVLDLREWDFETQGSVRLNGEWNFYWNRLLSTEEELSDFTPSFISVPGFWTKNKEHEAYPSRGYGTYHLKVLLPPEQNEMGLSLHDVETSYALFIDGRKRTGAGVVGRSEAESTPGYRSNTLCIGHGFSSLDIIIQVSNFQHRGGGLREVVKLGLSMDLQNQLKRNLAAELFLIGSIFIMALYHLSLFLFFNKNRTTLFFGLFCLILTIRTLVVGEMFAYELFPFLPWGVLHRIEYLTLFWSVPVFAMYIRAQFRDLYSRYVYHFAWISSSLYSLVLLAPTSIYSRTVVSYEILALVIAAYTLYVILRAAHYRRFGAGIILAGFLVVFLLLVNDVLYANQIVYTGYYSSFGLFVFILSQAYLLASRTGHLNYLLERQNVRLERMNRELDKSYRDFEKSRQGIIVGLANLAEFRDEDTGDHLHRISAYCEAIANELARLPKYSDYLTQEYIDDLSQSSILHDIGKVGIPDSILLKPGKLTEEEFEIMKLHTVKGAETIKNIENKMETDTFLTLGYRIAHYHHEKWDGTGYPEGLKGEVIPLSARIVAVADVYDALTSKRPYKEAFTHEKALS